MTIEQAKAYIERIKDEILLITEAKTITELNASYITISMISSLLLNDDIADDIHWYIENELSPSIDVITNYHLVRIASEITKSDMKPDIKKYNLGMCLQSIKGDDKAFAEERQLIEDIYNIL